MVGMQGKVDGKKVVLDAANERDYIPFTLLSEGVLARRKRGRGEAAAPAGKARNLALGRFRDPPWGH